MHTEISVERNGPVTTLVLARPQKRNALSALLVEEMLEVVDSACTDGTRLLVLKGEGKGFSGGFDFGDIEEQSDADLALRFVRLEILLQKLYHAPYATLALAHGACYGAAADMVCCCNRRVAAPGTRFRMPGLRFGIALGTRRLGEVIGADAARRVLETSAVFDAEEALAMRFLTAIEPVDSWVDQVEQASVEAVDLPPQSHRLLLEEMVVDHRDEDLSTLVRSVSTPGIKTRISEFLAESGFSRTK